MSFEQMNQTITDAVLNSSVSNEKYLTQKVDYEVVDYSQIIEIKNNQIQSKLNFNYSLGVLGFTLIFLGVSLGGVYFLPNELVKI